MSLDGPFRAQVFIGLGSNLGDRGQYLSQALSALATSEQTDIAAISSLYESDPLAGKDQPKYLNAVAKILTSLGPHQLLRKIQSIETKFGRERHGHWAPRTLDLDILLFADRVLDDPWLSVPHPGIYMRSFVLLPLQEIAQDLVFPDQTSIETRVKECPPLPISKLAVDEFQLPTNE